MTPADSAPPLPAGARVAVTGGTGFIGRAAVRALAEAGLEVTALLRGPRGAAAMRALGARPVVAPLRPGPALDAALAGCAAVVHLAYDVRAAPRENLDAFDALLAAAARAGVGRIVHASSIVVYDDWPGGGAEGRIDEASPRHGRPASGYRAAKLAMEDRLLAGPLPAALLQPTIVYGPGSELWTEAPLLALRRGGLMLPEPCGRAPLVHVDDVARAVVLAVGLPGLGRESFVVTGPEAPGWDALFEGYAAMVPGGRVVRAPLATLLPPETRAAPPASPSASASAGLAGRPGLAARASALLHRRLGRERVAALRRLAARLRGRRAPRRPAPFEVALLAASPAVESLRAADRLGYVPRIGLKRGLETIRQHYAGRLSV